MCSPSSRKGVSTSRQVSVKKPQQLNLLQCGPPVDLGCSWQNCLFKKPFGTELDSGSYLKVPGDFFLYDYLL